MDLSTVLLIVAAGWVSLLVAVVAMCKAAAFGDAPGDPAVERVRATAAAARAERARRFERPALG